MVHFHIEQQTTLYVKPHLTVEVEPQGCQICPQGQGDQVRVCFCCSEEGGGGRQESGVAGGSRYPEVGAHLMKVNRPIIPNWSTTMLAGMFVTRPGQECENCVRIMIVMWELCENYVSCDNCVRIM